MNNKCFSQSGVALLMVLGILVLLSIVGVAFATNMRLMERTTRDFIYEMQARYLAEAGIEYAIAELKEDARSTFIYNDNVSIDNQTGLLDGVGSIEDITIADSASKLNINYADKELLMTVIDGVGEKSAKKIVEQRDKCHFLTPRGIATVRDVYDDNEDSITVWGYCDPNTLDSPRPAVNVHTADSNLVEKLVTAINGIGSAGEVIGAIGGKTFSSWEQFNDEIDATGLSDSKKAKIKDNFNPNREKPEWNSNKASTEFCFHSGGTYEITATGTITKRGQVLSQKTITGAVKVFDLWNETTKEQFREVWESDKGGSGDSSGDPEDGEIVRVTWFDFCPVKSDENWNTNPPQTTINDSLKIGYWDDFDEESDDYYNFNDGEPGEWKNIGSNPIWGGSIHIDEYPAGSGNNMLTLDQWWEVMLCDNNKWNFTNISATVYRVDRMKTAESNEWDVGTFIFNYADGTDESIAVRYYPPTHPWGEHTVGVYAVPGVTGGSWLFPEFLSYPLSVVYKVVQKYNTSHDKSFAIINGSNTQSNPYCSGSGGFAGESNQNGGVIKFWTGTGNGSGTAIYNATRWDNLRVISDTGYYISTPSDQAYNPLNISETIEWGNLWGTVTLPEEDAGKIKFNASVDSGGLENPDDSVELSGDNADGIPLGDIGTSNSIQYRVDFECGDTDNYSTTPVLEDVWITYLPRTRILYWREGIE